MKNFLNSVKVPVLDSNLFDLSHDVKLSCNMGDLVPTLNMEVVPGDKINLSCEALTRLAPMVAPVMHRIDIYMHYFFVPNRILWPNWEKFITMESAHTGGLAPAAPVIFVNDTNYTKLMDYMGVPIPPAASSDLVVNLLPFYAYNKVYNDYYRDQNLVNKLEDVCLDGHNAVESQLLLMKRSWEHDYFTSCLPFAQKGPAVSIPITANYLDVQVFANQAAGTTLAGSPSTVPVDAQPPVTGSSIPADTLFARTSDLVATGTGTINDLRRAYRLQEFFELLGRAGSRMTEFLRSFFNETAEDARLQRAEYITGSKNPVIISEVLNTTGTDDAPQGNMSGHGVGVTSGYGGYYHVKEHGWIIGIMSVMPKTSYQQGLHKSMFKFDPLEYYFKQFANIGEQEVVAKELFAWSGDDEDVFGYIPRYAEYKNLPNRVAGDFRTNLDFWTMTRIFTTAPALNEDFIQCDPTHRIFAVTDPNVDKLYVQVLHKIKARRKMPVYGTPTF